jgi:hypothetical protein
MIHIIDNYYMSANSREFQLFKKTKKGYSMQGHYWSVAQLLVDLVKMEAFTAIESMNELSQVLEHTRAFGDRLKTPLVANLKEAVKAFEPEVS